QLARQVHSARNMSAARASAPLTGELAAIASIDQLKLRLAKPGDELVGREPKFGAHSRCEAGAGERDGASLDPSVLVDPTVPTPFEHTHVVVPVVAEGPPQAACKLASTVIDGDDMSLIADPAHGHGLGKPLGRRDLGGNAVVAVDDIPR